MTKKTRTYNLRITLRSGLLLCVCLCCCTHQKSPAEKKAGEKQWPNEFYQAVYANKLSVIKSMLKTKRQLVHMTIDNKITPLMVAASQGHVWQIRLYRSMGARIDAEDDMGRTALYYALMNNQAQAAAVLIVYQADVNHRSIDDMTPVMYAAAFGNVDIVKLLVAHGAEAIATGRWDALDARWWADKKEHMEVYEYLDQFYK